MNTYIHLTLDRGANDIVTVTIDVQDAAMNVFNDELLGELQQAVTELEQPPLAAMVVFRSGKESGFFAGADIARIRRIGSPSEAQAILQAGQDLFDRIDALPMPTVAVIHGPCLGGGLEFALACSHRVAVESSSTQLGLPETQLGLIPGWGGTQRLPRQIGLAAALRMILKGSRVGAAEAHRLGLVDAVISAEFSEGELDTFLTSQLDSSRSGRPSRGWWSWLRDHSPLGQRLMINVANRQIAGNAEHYPALPAAVRAIDVGLRDGMRAGLERERTEFSQVLFSPTCENLLGIFTRREQARKRSTWISTDTESPSMPQTVAVIGAGTMGAGIAQLAALHGHRVILNDVDDTATARGLQRVEKLIRTAVRKGAVAESEADQARARITATSQLSSVYEADLLIEAIIEDLPIKQKLVSELTGHIRPDAVLVSNTSALSIGAIGRRANGPQRIAGLHFFNPVHRMPLVEVVRGAATSEATIGTLVEFVRHLGKVPLVVADQPGFLVNRILFPYLDEAVRMVAEGGSIEWIDRDARRFGMPMGPLELIDTVGIDVAAKVACSLTQAGPPASPTPEILTALAANGHCGEKSGQGFYNYRKGRRRGPASLNELPDALLSRDGMYNREGIPESDFGGEILSEIQQRLFLTMINAASGCLENGVVAKPWMVDLGMVLGAGFPPFRGGPLRLAETWHWDDVVVALEQLTEDLGPRFRPSPWLIRQQQETTAQVQHAALPMADG